MENELYHSGVLGMHWGVRKSRTTRSGAHKKVKGKNKPTTSPVKKMSDQELRQKVDRLQLEKRYSELTKEPGKIEKGRKTVLSVTKDIGAISALAGSAVILAANYKKVSEAIGPLYDAAKVAVAEGENAKWLM